MTEKVHCDEVMCTRRLPLLITCETLAEPYFSRAVQYVFGPRDWLYGTRTIIHV